MWKAVEEFFFFSERKFHHVEMRFISTVQVNLNIFCIFWKEILL